MSSLGKPCLAFLGLIGLGLAATEAPAQTKPRPPGAYTAEDMEAPPPGPNPYLSILPAGADPDWSYWRARMTYEAALRRGRTPAPAAPVAVTEAEPAGVLGWNDLPVFAQEVPGFGARPGENPSAVVTGHLLELPVALGAFGEPDDTLPQAHAVALPAASSVVLSAAIGDGAHGSGGAEPSGDFDFYSFSATAGQTIEVSVRTPFPLADLDPIAALYDSAGTLLWFNDDIPLQGFVSTFDSYFSFTTTGADTYYVAVGGFYAPADLDVAAMLPSDPFDGASGPGAASEGAYELLLGLDAPSPPDVDFYRFELRAGDVFGATVVGGARRVALFDPGAGLRVASLGADASGVYPAVSPLPGGGSATIAYVVDTPGVYAVGVDLAAGPELGRGGSYSLELHVSRASLDREAAPESQILYLDFDGATFDAAIFLDFLGEVTLSPLADFLAAWGLGAADEDAVIDAIVAAVEENLSADVRARGKNGDFDASGRAGEFDVEIRNSRDHGDLWGAANVTRVVVGGTIAELGLRLIGIAEAIDVGNFAREKTGVVLLDLLSAPAPDPNSIRSFELAPGASILDLVGAGVGNVVAHEAGHLFGDFHTVREVAAGETGFPNVMDRVDLLGHVVGEDGVFGTADDLDVDFGPDVYEPREGFSGTEDTLNVISFDLPAGGLRPDITVDRTAHGFGALDPGAAAMRTFLVGNAGSADLAVSATALAGPDAAAFSIPSGGGPFTLAPAAARPVEVRFAPAGLGFHQATLEITSDDPDESPLSVSLSGYGGVPDIAIDSTSHDYGDLVYGPASLSATRTFTVSNTDSVADLHVSALAFTGADPGQFVVDGDAGPWVLGPGESRPFDVLFAPGGLVGEKSARLRIPSNDPDESPLDVLLRGRALGPDVTVTPGSPYFYGVVRVGERVFRRFHVGNAGQLDLVVSATGLFGADVDEFTIDSGGGAFTLLPREVRQVQVSFRPATEGDKIATFEIASNDPDEGVLEVLLLGQGVVPDVVVEPASFDFGDVVLGIAAFRTFQVVNNGEGSLLGSASLEGPDAVEYAFEGQVGSFRISPGASLPVRVRFRPALTGLKQATLRLTSNDPDQPVLDVPLAGRGVTSADIPALSLPGLLGMVLALAVAAVWTARRRRER